MGGIGGRSLLAVGCALAAISAGCGGSSSDSSAPASTAAQAPATTQAAPTPTVIGSPPKQGERFVFAPNPYREPTSPGPHPGATVDHVIIHEVKRGRGLALRPGDSVYADYIEANYTTGHKFLRAWKNHRPFGTENMVMDSPMWMRGLIKGMTGMRPGGRRTIIVPRNLSDLEDSDRAGNSFHEIVYWDVVLRRVDRTVTK